MGYPPPRNLSIRFKLPLVIGGLLVLVSGIYAAAIVQSVRKASLAVATERLEGVTDQLAGMLTNSRGQLLTTAQQLGDTAAVSAYLAHQDRRTEAAARAMLQPTGPQAAQFAAVALWSAEPRRLLAVGNADRWAPGGADPALLAEAAHTDSGVIGRFLPVGDTLVYPVAAPLRRHGQLIGYLVQWRRITNSAQARASATQVSGLIGTGTHLYVGNLADDVWTDLAVRVPKPPVDITRTSGFQQYTRTGDSARSVSVVAAVRAVPQTPWGVVIEFPRQLVLAPASLFLRRLPPIAGLILLLGLLAGWALSLPLTRPLTRLTRAAEALAGGDYAQQLEVEDPQVDELGRLATAFATMVERVGDAHRDLERRVLERTAELQERNEELEAFAYSISHDLRAPLRAMEGFSQALLEDYSDKLDEPGRGFAQRVVTAARTMDQLIRDLLAYSKITRAELRPAAVDLNRVAQGAVRQLDAEVQRRQARIDIEPLPAAFGHEAIVGQVLANLLGNALKFVPPDRVPTIHVHAEPRNGRVRLWVEDNGIGIAPEYHERIFRVFERLHRNEDYPGTGIGLAIVRKAVERMGGAVGVESAAGAGSKFWIELKSAEQGARDSGERRSHSAG
jgi:signal transduction histidine kinase